MIESKFYSEINLTHWKRGKYYSNIKNNHLNYIIHFFRCCTNFTMQKPIRQWQTAADNYSESI